MRVTQDKAWAVSGSQEGMDKYFYLGCANIEGREGRHPYWSTMICILGIWPLNLSAFSITIRNFFCLFNPLSTGNRMRLRIQNNNGSCFKPLTCLRVVHPFLLGDSSLTEWNGGSSQTQTTGRKDLHAQLSILDTRLWMQRLTCWHTPQLSKYKMQFGISLFPPPWFWRDGASYR